MYKVCKLMEADGMYFPLSEKLEVLAYIFHFIDREEAEEYNGFLFDVVGDAYSFYPLFDE